MPSERCFSVGFVMKIWLVVVLLGFLAPINAYAQDVEETSLDPIVEDADENGPAPLIVSDSQKLGFIIATVHSLNAGPRAPQVMQITEQDEMQVPAGYIEALIHSEGPDAIRRYHTNVRTMMKDNVEWTKYDGMLLTINEIKMLSRHMDWKALRSHLLSLDRYSEENFPIWTKMRVESWLVQAEIMLYLRPDDDEKSRAIEGLVAKVRLAQKTSDDLEYDFTISDRVIDIEEGRVPDMTLLSIAEPQTEEEKMAIAQLGPKKEEKKGFFGRTLKKLKFW